MESFWVILDANFLMIPESHGVDIFSEINRLIDRDYELVVPEVIVGELKNLKESESSSEKRAAEVALKLAEKAKKVSSKKVGDEEIIRLAKERKCVVGTNDSSLRKKLREMGTPVIYLRQKSHLDISSKI